MSIKCPAIDALPHSVSRANEPWIATRYEFEHRNNNPWTQESISCARWQDVTLYLLYSAPQSLPPTQLHICRICWESDGLSEMRSAACQCCNTHPMKDLPCKSHSLINHCYSQLIKLNTSQRIVLPVCPPPPSSNISHVDFNPFPSLSSPFSFCFSGCCL